MANNYCEAHAVYYPSRGPKYLSGGIKETIIHNKFFTGPPIIRQRVQIPEEKTWKQSFGYINCENFPTYQRSKCKRR